MARVALNLTGQWSGEFAYPGNLGPTTPFLAVIQEESGHLSGSIIEPDIVSGGPSVTATIAGLRTGTSVDFTKAYPSEPYGYENPVDYVGSLSGDGNTVTGVWSLLEWDGKFEMRREAGGEELLEAEAEESIPMPELVGDPET